MPFAALKPDDLIVDVLCKVQKLCFSSQQCMQGFLYAAWLHSHEQLKKSLSNCLVPSWFQFSTAASFLSWRKESYFYLWWCIFTALLLKSRVYFACFCFFFPLHGLNLIWTLSSYKTLKWPFSLCHLSGPKGGSYYFAAQYLNSEVSHASVIIMHTFSALHTHNALSAIELRLSKHLFSNRPPHALCIFIMCGL